MLLSQEMVKEKKPRIVVLDLKPQEGVSETTAKWIGDVVRSEIINSREFTVIPKSLIQNSQCVFSKAKNNKDKLDTNRIYDELCAVEVGKTNTAKFATYGYIYKIDCKPLV